MTNLVNLTTIVPFETVVYLRSLSDPEKPNGIGGVSQRERLR
jgi:hypothetical protein